MAAAAILDNFEWPYIRIATPHDLYLYSMHRAVIFAIAQLSCSTLHFYNLHKIALTTTNLASHDVMLWAVAVGTGHTRQSQALAVR